MGLRLVMSAFALVCGASFLMALGAAALAGLPLATGSYPGAGAEPGEVAAPGSGSDAGSGARSDGVPSSMLVLYERAARTCPGLSWGLLGAIGTVESSNGISQLPGVHFGQNRAGAEGPMQFEPATFAEYDEPVPPGGAEPPSPYDPVDSVYAAARLLCANGAAGGADVSGAVFAYNHSVQYVEEVISLATEYDSSRSAVGGH